MLGSTNTDLDRYLEWYVGHNWARCDLLSEKLTSLPTSLWIPSQMKKREPFLQQVSPDVTLENTSFLLPIKINFAVSPSLCLSRSLPLAFKYMQGLFWTLNTDFISASSRCNETVMMPILCCRPCKNKPVEPEVVHGM